MKVEFFKHSVGDEEIESIAQAIRGKFLTNGPIVEEFECALAEYMGMKYAVAVSSCTAALHLSLLAVGVEPCSEVIVPAMTFVATALAVMHAGASPVIVDVLKKDGNVDPEKVYQRIREKTKAVVPVRLYGSCCDEEAEIGRMCSRDHVPVIVDAAHALEMTKGRVVSNFDGACLSFYATKSITCGDGGAFVTDNEHLYEKVKLLRTHGMSADASARYHNKYTPWDLVAHGWKYNMTDIQAAMLLPQLKRVDTNWQSRKEAYDRYVVQLKDVEEIVLPEIPKDRNRHSHHLFTVWTKDENTRNALIRFLNTCGVGVAVNYKSINLTSYLSKRLGAGRGMCPVSERIGDVTISLPFYAGIPYSDIDYVCSCIKRFYSKT
ncbi:MAG: DegT/DnrJ/EryC1/StrS family aminotransferase [Candidatus Paceibacterota bacterium]